MKNKIVITATITMIAIVASIGFNMSISKQTTTFSTKNIEALASGEGEGTVKKFPRMGRPIGSGMWQYYCANQTTSGCSE
ncbi:NVEALA domain-containing protein [Butyricimonas paravirosa]